MTPEEAMAAEAGSGPTSLGWLWALPLVLVAAMVALVYAPAVIGWVRLRWAQWARQRRSDRADERARTVVADRDNAIRREAKR